MHRVIDAWGAADAPLYDLDRHNCVGFVAALARAADLETPAAVGRDPVRFLEAVKQLNRGRVAALARPTPDDRGASAFPRAGSAP
jgi:hypothetical protein